MERLLADLRVAVRSLRRSPGFAIDVVQEMSTVVHEKTGLPASDNNSVRINATRLVVRLGLGL